MNRRAFMAGTVAMTATPSLAVGVTPMPSETADEEILRHAQEICRIMSETAPEGAMLKGFQFSCHMGAFNPESVWASGITEDYRLTHMRPGVYEGWRTAAPVRIVG